MNAPEELSESAPVTERCDRSPANLYRRSIFGVPINVVVSIGRQRMSVSELLELRADSIVPLTSQIDDPVDLIVDDKIVARGELIETDQGGLAVRISEIDETQNA